MTGKLIIFEGPDGVGKTTIAEEVAKVLSTKDLNVKSYSFPGKHSPGTLGCHIYNLHHDKEKYGIEEMCPESLQILHIAAHVDLLKRCIIPDLENGNIVILDRFWWSTMVYGLVAGIDEEFLECLCTIESDILSNNLSYGNKIVFLINGEYRRDNPPENFDELCAAYANLLNGEFNFGYGYSICNTNSLDHIVNRVLGILGEFHMREELLEQWTN